MMDTLIIYMSKSWELENLLSYLQIDGWQLEFPVMQNSDGDYYAILKKW